MHCIHMHYNYYYYCYYLSFMWNSCARHKTIFIPSLFLWKRKLQIKLGNRGVTYWYRCLYCICMFHWLRWRCIVYINVSLSSHHYSLIHCIIMIIWCSQPSDTYSNIMIIYISLHLVFDAHCSFFVEVLWLWLGYSKKYKFIY